MAKLIIDDYKYRSNCDTYGCRKKARYMIHKHGTPKSVSLILCEECLQQIAQKAPLDMVLSREDVQEHVRMLSAGASAETSADEAQAGRLINSYSYKELQEIAKELGVPYVGIKTDELRKAVLAALEAGAE